MSISKPEHCSQSYKPNQFGVASIIRRKLEGNCFTKSAAVFQRILLPLFLLFSVSLLQSVSAQTHVQTNTLYQNTTSTTISRAFSATSTTGNLIVVSLTWDGQTRSISTVTDNKGNTYARINGPTNWFGSNYRGELWYAYNITGGGAAINVTATLTGAPTSFSQIYISEYGGIVASNPLDQNSVNTGNNVNVSSGSRTTTIANELIYGASVGASGTLSVGTGFTARSTANQNIVEDKVVTSTGSYDAAFNMTSGGNRWIAQMASFITATITTGTITGSPFCAGSAISIPFTVPGNFISGNVFTAQLSDASGSFASPVSLGTLTQTTSGTITGTIPAGTVAGTGYRIRVIGSSPSVTGSTSAAITINVLPSSPSAGNNSRCGTGTVAITATPGAGQTIDWYAASTGGSALLSGNTSYTTPSISSTTVYYAQARNTTTGCVSTTRTAVTATINPAPNDVSASAASTNICSGSSTNIVIASSQSGVNYQLRNNTGNVLVGTAVAGTGGSINLPTGSLTASTTFNILATNASNGCNLQLTTLVTVSMDNIAPVISSCPSNQTINLDASCSAVMPNYISSVTVSDNCTATGSITVIQSPAAGSPLASTGNITVTITATDASGNSSNCTFTLTKADVTAPSITCPANISVNADPNSCGAIVNYTVSATDNCLGFCAPSSIPGYTSLGTLNGHTYFRSTASTNWTTANANAIALGAHLVTIGSAAENSFLSTAGISWTAMTDQAVEGTWVWSTGEPVTYTNWNAGEPNNSGGNENYMHINYSVAGGWNDIAGTGSYPAIIEFDCVSTTMTSGYASGSLFPIGTTTVSHTATDAAGNSSSCSFTVTVTDNIAPTITCPANISVNTLPGECTAIVNYTTPWVTDNCGGCTVAPAITGYTSLGVYNGSAYYISNSTMTGPAAFTAAATQGGQVATISSASENTFVRNAATAAGYNVNYFIGVNDVNVEGTFVGGSNETLSYFNWNAGEPNNSGNEDYVQVYPSGVWNDIGATAVNNYILKVNCITPTRTSGLASGSAFPVGTNTINYSATDASGNTSTCLFTITVSLNPTSIGKTISALASTICAGSGTNVRVSASETGISYQLRNNATNANIGSPVIGTGGAINLPTGALTSTTTFNILATNTSNSCSYQLTNTITITVNALPTVTSPASVCVGSTATLSPTTGGTWASSNTSFATVTNAGVVTGVAAGSVTFTFTQTSTGCTATTSSVAVNALPIAKTPTAASSIVCSGTGTNIQIATSQVGIEYQLRNNAGNVLVGSAVSGTGGTINLPTGNLSAATTFNVLATNATTGCSSQMPSTLTITIDNAPPVITCPGTQTINLGSSCDAVIPDYTSLAVVSDNCTASSGITITQSPAAGTTVSLTGTVVVTLTATDASGYFSSCTFNLVKQDVTAPVINCPGNITVNVTPGLCGAIVNYSVTATDNCNGTSCAPASIPGYTLIGSYNGHTYFRSNTSALWPTAKSNAVALGAHLATISSAGENAFLAGIGQHWGGMSDETTEGTWTWVTGEPVVYTSWAAGEPNNSGGNQDYMVLNYSGTNWDDQGTTTSGSLPSVIEFDCMSTNLVTGLPSGSIFPVGTTTVTYNATDISGNTSSNCSFTVTVNDNIAPTIVCPSNISVNAAVGACDAVVNYTAPVATDNCGNCSTPPTLTGMTLLGTNNGKAYYISNSNFTWTAANTAAVAQGGYLAAIDDATENTYILNKVATAVAPGTNYWIGLNDAATEGTFVWSNGQPVSYTNWQAGQPDNGGGTEDYAHIWTAAGTWNDITPASTMRYVLELPCIPVTLTSGLASGSAFPIGTTTINYSATDASGNTSNCSFTVTVAINPTSIGKAVSAASTTICGGSSTNVRVSGSETGSSYQLRDNATNTNIGSPVTGTGGAINLPTGALAATTTFNILATNTAGGCTYQLTNTVTVNVNPAPSISASSSNSRCGTGTVTITATPGAGETIDWYAASTGGTALLSGNNSYTTPSISATTTYYAQARNTTTGCLSVSRTAVTATINAIPAAPTAGNNSTCGNGSVTITATPGTGQTIDWYAASTGGTALLSGNTSYTTPSISSTTTYYAEARNSTSNCISVTRTPVTATINTLPTDKAISALSTVICSGTSATIQVAASQSGVNYQLRNNATNANVGGIVAGNGGIISLPSGSLTTTTTFNVLATNATSCSVQMSTTVTVTVNATGLWIGGTTGVWDVPGNWCGGVPTSSTNVVIPSGSTITIQTSNAAANSINISSGGSLVMTGANNLSISSGGTFTNNGTFTATSSTGTVAFLGNGTISGTTTFKNVDTYGALDFGTSSTINGTFTIQTGGSVTGNSPNYNCPSATLAYNTGSTYLRGLEWTSSSSGAGVPANVIIQNNTVINFPTVGQGYVCNDLQIENGSSLRQDYSGGSAVLRVGRNITINGVLSLGGNNGGDLYVGGSWTRTSTGVFNHNDRKVVFDGPVNFSGNGTSMSTISAPASTAKNNEGGFGGENFAHLWINKTNATDSVVLLSNITVNREVGLTKGTFSLRNSDVTLVSNDTRTADVAPITNTSNASLRYGGTGRFAVQRFIHNPTGTRSWRLVAAPLEPASAPTINQAYQEGVVNPDRTNPNASGGIYNPWPGYGTHITGPGGTYSLANGFDQGTNSSSILYAGPGVLTWPTPVSTKSVKVTDQPGWMLFARGDRGFVIGGPYQPSQNLTLEPKGKINTGDVVKPIVAGKQVVGNPYPSAISLLNVDVAGTSGGNAAYYMWDPKMYTSYTSPGKWVTFAGIGSSFVQTTSASAYTSDGTIESGMAFILDAPTAGTITFHESDKLPLSSSLVGNTSGVLARPVQPLTIPMFRTDVYANNAGKYTLTDGVLNVFDASFDNEVSIEDARKFINFNTKESFSIARDAERIAIEKRRDIKESDTIFYAMSKMNELPYQLRFEATNFSPGVEAFLEDKFVGIKTPVSTSGVTTYNFNINTNALSKAEDRFKVIFKSAYTVLPVTFTSVVAWAVDNDIAVQWNVANEMNVKQYNVLKSVDGARFETIGTVAAEGNGQAELSYKFTDVNPVQGTNYYRIQSEDKDGKVLYSNIVKVDMAAVDGMVKMYTNPVVNNDVKLSLANMQKGTYNIRLLNSGGQLIKVDRLVHPGGSAIYDINPDQVLAKGLYHVEISKPGYRTITLKVSVQ